METLTTTKATASSVPEPGDAQIGDVLRTLGLRKIFTSGSQQIVPLGRHRFFGPDAAR